MNISDVGADPERVSYPDAHPREAEDVDEDKEEILEEEPAGPGDPPAKKGAEPESNVSLPRQVAEMDEDDAVEESRDRKLRLTKTQIRRVIREALQALSPGDPVDTFDKAESLQPGDRVTIRGAASVIISVDSFSATLVYALEGKATLKDLDYRMAVRFDDDPDDLIPEIEIVYKGPGQVPKNLRRAPRKKGPGRSYSYYD